MRKPQERKLKVRLECFAMIAENNKTSFGLVMRLVCQITGSGRPSSRHVEAMGSLPRIETMIGYQDIRVTLRVSNG